MYVLNGSRPITQKAAAQVQEVPTAEASLYQGHTLININIVLIEPRYLLRECLAKGLESSSSFKVSAYANVGDWIASGASPSTAILMLSAGGRCRREVLADFDILSKAGNQLPVVLLAQQESIECILEMLEKGARGYVPLSLPIGVAVEAIHLVMAGGTFVPASSLVAARIPAAPESLAFHVGDAVFTHRQAAVLEALRSGKANKIIAYELSMQESTVKVHIRNIMRKLNAKNRTEVAVIINAFKGDARHQARPDWSGDMHAM